MTLAQRFGLALALAAALGLGGCAETLKQWDAGFVAVPPVHHHQRKAQRSAAVVTDPEVTGSAPAMVQPVAAESAVMACSRKLYLETATSTESIRAAEEVCKQLIVNQPY